MSKEEIHKILKAHGFFSKDDSIGDLSPREQGNRGFYLDEETSFVPKVDFHVFMDQSQQHPARLNGAEKLKKRRIEKAAAVFPLNRLTIC